MLKKKKIKKKLILKWLNWIDVIERRCSAIPVVVTARRAPAADPAHRRRHRRWWPVDQRRASDWSRARSSAGNCWPETPAMPGTITAHQSAPAVLSVRRPHRRRWTCHRRRRRWWAVRYVIIHWNQFVNDNYMNEWSNSIYSCDN